MSDKNASGFGAFVPGFDFLQGLVQSAAGGGTTGVPGASPDWSKWVAPTMQAEEIDKRINELKTVQFWLEQNARALAATIQALEVQKMTLATLRGMNVHVSDLAGAFGFGAAAPAAPAASAPAFSADRTAGEPGPYDDMFTRRDAPAAADEATPASAPAPVPPPPPPAPPPSPPAAPPAAAAPPAVDPLQWWNALAGQFQQIAAGAMQDAAEHARTSGAPGLQDAARQAFDAAGRMAAQVASATTAATTPAKTPAKKAAQSTPAASKKAGTARPAKKAAAQKSAVRKPAVKQPTVKKAVARKTGAGKPDPRNDPASPVTWRRVR